MKRLKKTAFFLTSCYLFITAFMFLLQEKLIFLPTQLPQDYTYNFERPYEEFFIETADGARLNALRFTTENPKGIILYFHGNAGDLSRWGEITSYFIQYDYEVLVMDYRTYGKSTGTLSESELYKDASLFYNKALEWFPENQITVYGRSLGTTFAIHVASENNPKQLILEAPFFSLEAVAKKRYWFLPIKPMLKYRFPSSEKIKNVQSLITIFHGTNDGVVPYKNGELLQKIPSNNQCRLVTIPKGTHNDLINHSEYHEEIRKLLNE
ncbi:MAG: alpha/beta hydrolase [Flavobacteriaceae bacterium]|nr:alpha/beta hydrolase [Flavobacteriaceae bacterium]